MDYKMSVKEFLSHKGKINYSDFYEALENEIKRIDKRLSVFQTIVDKNQLKKTKPIKPFFGLPVSVKDCICVKDMKSYAGSRILEGYVPPFDATAVERAKLFGSAIIGKTNQDEFGFGTFSVNSGYGIPKNPFDASRSAGGSSGGAAALTAALDFPHIAIAESTGGSISCPASFCGVVGLTPTYGLVSRYGLIDYANSMDKIGVISKCVYDAALMLSAINGYDPKDSTSLLHTRHDYTEHLNKNASNIKIAIPKEYTKGLDRIVEKEFKKALDVIKDLGAVVKEVKLPTTKYAVAAYYIIATSEASTNLAKFCGMRYGLHKKLDKGFNEYFSKVRSAGFGEEAKRRIILGTFARMSGYRNQYYLKAMKVRTEIIKDFKRIFKKFDVIVSPTMPIVAPKFSEIRKMPPIKQYQMDILTVPVNLAGMPHISVPCKNYKKGEKPVGLQIIADHLQEEKILRIANAFEKAR